MHAFWLVIKIYLLDDRRKDHATIKKNFSLLSYKTNRLNVTVGLYSNGSQKMSQCGKDISDTLCNNWCAALMFSHILMTSGINY